VHAAANIDALQGGHQDVYAATVIKTGNPDFKINDLTGVR
jgi:hypothetical protein